MGHDGRKVAGLEADRDSRQESRGGALRSGMVELGPAGWGWEWA